MLPSRTLSAAFFLSGAAGLIFQVVWVYRCGLVLGSSVAAVTVVLSAFMGGLAAGNAVAAFYAKRLARPVAAYARLEIVVAIAGVAITYAIPYSAALLIPAARFTVGSSALLNGMRFGFTFMMLLVPAIAMGATLPILVGALCRAGDRFGAALGRLYGWNTLGAVAGVIGAEVVLIATVGVGGSAWVAAALNAGAAAIAMMIRVEPARPLDREQVPTKPNSTTPRPMHADDEGTALGALLCATALSGAVLLALEVVWFRFLSMYVLVTTLAMSLMLAVVMSGIGAGGLVAGWWLRRRPHASVLPVVACLTGLAVIGSYVAFQLLTSGTQVGDWRVVLWFAIVLTLPVSWLSGIIFTLIGDTVHGGRADGSASAGWLTFANTAGAVCGPPLATYVLLPLAGMERTTLVLAALYAVVALLVYRGVSNREVGVTDALGTARVARLASAVALALALVALPFGAMSNRYFSRAAATYAGDGSVIVATREGPSEISFVMQQQWMGRPVYSRLVTNGFSMSGTALPGQRYMRAFAYYPMLLHDGPLRRALVVCYGVGVTVGATTDIASLETIDVAEISRDIVSMSAAIYPAGERPLDDPRIRLHIEDGRFFLHATSNRYDLITGEPPPPRTPGAVNIYTREYFQLVRDRLAPGGIATYWVPVGRPRPGTDVNTIIRAFCEVFEDCSLWNATPFDLMLVGSQGLRGQRTFDQFSRPWQTPGLEARLREVAFERSEQIGATFVGDAPYLRELTAPTPPLTDDFPQRLRPVRGRPSLSDPMYGVDPAVMRMYQSTLDVGRARAAFSGSAFIRSIWPPELIERTLPFFDAQSIINRVYWEGGHPLGQIEALDRVLSTTTLRTLPLWILGSDEVRQRIGETATTTDGSTEYSRALRAISGRDFTGAAQLLTAAARRGFQSTTEVPLLAYVLVKGGRADDARLLLAAARPGDDEERNFWEWLRRKLEIGR